MAPKKKRPKKKTVSNQRAPRKRTPGSGKSAKRKVPRKKKSSLFALQLKRSAIGIISLAVLVLVSATGFRYWLLPNLRSRHQQTPAPTIHKVPLPQTVTRKKKAAPKKTLTPTVHKKRTIKALKPYHKPAFEVYSKAASALPPPKKRLPPPPGKGSTPRVAIIIDDIGYDYALAKKFLNLGPGITLSVLPFSPYQKKILQKARAMQRDVMLHMPMEPEEYPRVNPGPGALLTTMSPDTLLAALNKALDSAPMISGINNHMGSRLTSNSSQMNSIFNVLKKRHLFFIDSRTTTKTRTRESARLFKVPFAERDIFLDHEPTKAFIRRQLKKLLKRAITHEEAIGIGHPHNVTYEILREELPKLKGQVQFVPAARIVHPAG